MILNVKLIRAVGEIDDGNRRIIREERDLLAESSEDLSVRLHYYFYIVDSDILEAIKSAGRVREGAGRGRKEKRKK